MPWKSRNTNDVSFTVSNLPSSSKGKEKQQISSIDDIEVNDAIENELLIVVDDDIVSETVPMPAGRTINNRKIIISNDEADEKEKGSDISPMLTSSDNESDNDKVQKLFTTTTNSIAMDVEADQINNTVDAVAVRKSSRIAESQPHFLANMSSMKPQ